jgi:hypothetical protein
LLGPIATENQEQYSLTFHSTFGGWYWYDTDGIAKR